jgi:predicted phage terminase large subunit-like protein
VWNAGVIVTAGNAKIEAFGAGKRIRGRRHGPHRPDLAIGDDLENDENVKSPEQRDKLEAWLTRSVLSLGGVGAKLDVVVVGTILHYDSVLSRLLGNPLWRGRTFRSILRWPDRMDLWDRWEEILLTRGETGEAREEAAWRSSRPAARRWSRSRGLLARRRPLYGLMLKRARDGHSAFDSEQQNDPLQGEDAPFATCITFWVQRLAEWLFFGACDPSLGKAGQGRDPSALLVGGYCRQTGVLDVVEASIRRRLPDRIIEDVLALQAEYRCLLWGVEAVQFQEFLRTQLMARGAERGVPVPARPVIPATDKPCASNPATLHAQGRIRLHPSQHELVSQLRHFPKADHDEVRTPCICSGRPPRPDSRPWAA